ncbi:MAG TPA: metallophosphoesterase, partial [Longimicrobiales bacterium]|nr:metallophosphoesterase [Longimicrobiales bacterium]
AVELMGRLPRVPTVVTPGNHDVPLYRLWERAFGPYRNWRAQVAAELDSVTRVPEGTFVALNSSAPRRAIVNGRLGDRQLDFARRSFADAPSSGARVLVIHHHFVPTPDGTGGRPLPRAAELVRAFEEMRVDFVLGGHVHRTHVNTSLDVPSVGGLAGIPLIACGTTTSRRGRGPEKGLNSLNVVRVLPREVEVHPHVLVPRGDRFEPREPITMRRGFATEAPLTTEKTGP